MGADGGGRGDAATEVTCVALRDLVALKPGQAMHGDIVYDGASGQLLSASVLDYYMPRADDLPNFDVDVHPIPTDSNPLGVKGAGEFGTVGGPFAVINAVADALAPRSAAPTERKMSGEP